MHDTMWAVFRKADKSLLFIKSSFKLRFLVAGFYDNNRIDGTELAESQCGLETVGRAELKEHRASLLASPLSWRSIVGTCVWEDSDERSAMSHKFSGVK